MVAGWENASKTDWIRSSGGLRMGRYEIARVKNPSHGKPGSDQPPFVYRVAIRRAITAVPLSEHATGSEACYAAGAYTAAGVVDADQALRVLARWPAIVVEPIVVPERGPDLAANAVDDTGSPSEAVPSAAQCRADARTSWSDWVVVRYWPAAGNRYAVVDGWEGKRRVYRAMKLEFKQWWEISRHWFQTTARQACERHAARRRWQGSLR